MYNAPVARRRAIKIVVALKSFNKKKLKEAFYRKEKILYVRAYILYGTK